MSENEKDVLAILERMQQQLTFLEKKLDTLLEQSRNSQNSQPRSFDRQERNFSRPFRPYNRPNRPDQNRGPRQNGYGQGQGQGHYSGHGRPSHGNHNGPAREGNFAPKKKPYFSRGRN
jgi:hypothetical protein